MAKIRRLHDIDGDLLSALEAFDDPAEQDRPPSEFLQRLVLDFGERSTDLCRIALGGPGIPGPAAEAALLLVSIACIDPSVPGRVRSRFEEAAVPVWRAALRARELPDRVRAHILPLLASFGVELDERERALLPERADEHLHGDPAGPFVDDLDGLDCLLQAANVLPDIRRGRGVPEEEAFERGVASLEGAADSGVAAAPFLLCVAAAAAAQRGWGPERVLPLLEAAASAGTPEAAWALAELGRWPGPEAIHRRAAALAGEIGARGTSPRAPGTVRVVRAWAIAPDGAGSRSAGVVGTDPGGGVHSLFLLLNEPRGVLDAWALHEEDSHLEDRLEDSPTPPVPVGLPFVRSLAGDALHRHRLSGRPVPAEFLLLRPLLGGEPLQERPHAPDPGVPPGGGRGAPRVGGSAVLAERDPFGGYWFSSDAVYDFVRRHRSRRGLDDLSSLRPSPALLDAFAGEVLEGERAGLLRLLDHALEIESLAPKPRKRVLDQGRRVRTVLALPEVPPGSIPFVAALVRRSLEVVDENVMAGFRNQADANRDALERDEAEAARWEERGRDLQWGLLPENPFDGEAPGEEEGPWDDEALLAEIFGDAPFPDPPPPRRRRRRRNS